MRHYLKAKLKAFLMRYPELGIAMMRAVRPFRFRSEKRAYRQGEKGEGNGRPSIVFFGHYRCGTMMLMRRLNDMVAGLGYKRRDFQGLVHDWPLDQRFLFQRDREGHRQNRRFASKGRFYSPLRYFVDIPDLQDYKTILVLRDPRDVLVSSYYSNKYAHVRLDQRFLDHCREVEQMGVDEYVLSSVQRIRDHYEFYMDHAGDLKNALVVNYESVISDFRGFLEKVNDYAGLGKSSEEVQAIADKESFTVDKEDKYSHKRSVKARNFEDKLKPETISNLNRQLENVLVNFGWDEF